MNTAKTQNEILYKVIVDKVNTLVYPLIGFIR